ncbi:IPT/TIG domain-containing protein, partial [Chloroflexota bacterium]
MCVISTPTLAAPMITLSPTSGTAGTIITIHGTNFQSYVGDNIFILFDDIEISSSLRIIPESGDFTIDFAIPDNAEPGRHWVRV